MGCREGVREPSLLGVFGNDFDRIRNDAGNAHPAPGRGAGLSDLWVSLSLPIPTIWGIPGAV